VTGKIRVLLADDHALVREMLRGRIDHESDMEVVGVAGDGNEAAKLAIRLRPDIVVLDIDMPGQTSFAAAQEIKRRSVRTRILFLSGFFNDRYIEDALASQASGYLTKDEPPRVLLQAIRMAASGLAYFSPKVQSRLVVEKDGMRLAGATRTRVALLTQRELETVRYLARGLSKKEIAELMQVSVKTVERHTQNSMDKLDIHDRVDLARFAIREGLAEA
jgi:DNA-binding NarL/FixJ family response regulator